MYALLNVAFALLAGLLMTRIFSRWRLPDVTAFLVAGVLIGPFCLGRLGITGVGFAAYEDVAALGTISDVAMGFIAFAIGNGFRLEDLRKTGRQAFIIGIVQALVATALVDLAMLGFHFLRPDILSAPAAITLGAIAAATAPAATLMRPMVFHSFCNLVSASAVAFQSVLSFRASAFSQSAFFFSRFSFIPSLSALKNSPFFLKKSSQAWRKRSNIFTFIF